MIALIITTIPHTYTNGNTNVTETNKLVNFYDNNYFTKKIKHTTYLSNNRTRHNHKKYEHNVLKSS